MILTEKEAFQRLYSRGYYLFRKDIPFGECKTITRYSILNMLTMRTMAGECMKLEDVEDFIKKMMPGAA